MILVLHAKEVPPPVPVPQAGGKAPAKGAPPPPVEAPSELPLPKTHWSISYSSIFAYVEGEPTEPVPPDSVPVDGQVALERKLELVFNYNFNQRFRVEASTDGLELLINSKVSLQLHESGSGTVIASIHLDLLPFASKGDERIELHDIQLEPAASGTEGIPKVCLRLSYIHFSHK